MICALISAHQYKKNVFRLSSKVVTSLVWRRQVRARLQPISSPYSQNSTTVAIRTMPSTASS